LTRKKSMCISMTNQLFGRKATLAPCFRSNASSKELTLKSIWSGSWADWLCVVMLLIMVTSVGPVFGQVPPPERQTQLAGNSLVKYPFFEYVKAFNKDATVKVAIDPTRFPGIVGETGDIYVVVAKTAAQWMSDPSLHNVVGNPLTVNFGGSTVQANTFQVAGPNELDADAGIGLGVGYDVVIDIDQNGVLSTDDYIDGLGSEAGLYIVHDVSQPGPLAVTEVIYSGGTWLGQDTYYPTDISTMGKLPLIVISHGNGHDYTWYDHIGNHMASYGYIVMSHQNNTGPGIETASTTTLTNTDYIVGHQDTISGGVLDGHIDSHRITWIGHSRGGEGITRAYDRLFDSDYTPNRFTIDDVVLLSSMLPTDFLKTPGSNPHDVNYHLWTAPGDANVSGSANCDICQTYHLHERATKYRMSTTVQGTGHGDFHDASGSVFTGPCHVTPKLEVHKILKGLFLPLTKYFVDGNVPAVDFLWRQYESFHPIGIDLSNPCIVVSHEYRNGSDNGNFMIDDYQTEISASVSSSGGSVTYTVTNLTEGNLNDNNGDFSWNTSDPFNGATQASSSDDSRGIVFDWNGIDRYYEWEIIPSRRDFSDDLYLSFRGAQGTQHPFTLTKTSDLTFNVTLRDGTGSTSSINIGAYGGGLEQPYARSGGWHNEMEVIRIRLTDFLTNGSGLDLTNIVAVRFDFGPSWGSNEGRIVIDELMLTNDVPPPAITVYHDSVIPSDATSYKVEVRQKISENNYVNLDGALVTLSKNGVIIGTATSSNGVATIDLVGTLIDLGGELATTGRPDEYINVTVTKHNYRPYLSRTTVLKPFDHVKVTDAGCLGESAFAVTSAITNNLSAIDWTDTVDPVNCNEVDTFITTNGPYSAENVQSILEHFTGDGNGDNTAVGGPFNWFIAESNDVSEIMYAMANWSFINGYGIAVPTRGNYNNWVTVEVASASAPFSSSGAVDKNKLDIEGFWVDDPSKATDREFVVAKNWIDTTNPYYQPIEGIGMYQAVIEPPEKEGSAVLRESKGLADAAPGAIDAAVHGIEKEFTLTKNSKFNQAYNNTLYGEPISVKRIDSGDDYYLVPFAKDDGRITVVARVQDGDHGKFLGTSDDSNVGGAVRYPSNPTQTNPMTYLWDISWGRSLYHPIPDFVPNGCIDREDLTFILSKVRSNTTYDSSLDLNWDDEINIADARMLVTYFTNPRGASCL